MKYSEIKDGAMFFWEGWLHRKIDYQTSIAFRYAASDLMDADEMVELVELEDLVSFALERA